jgi:hypothetical protein
MVGILPMLKVVATAEGGGGWCGIVRPPGEVRERVMEVVGEVGRVEGDNVGTGFAGALASEKVRFIIAAPIGGGL